jgi:hypothetical protein
MPTDAAQGHARADGRWIAEIAALLGDGAYALRPAERRLAAV